MDSLYHVLIIAVLLNFFLISAYFNSILKTIITLSPLFFSYIAMIFAELVSMFPKAGGIYEFCKNAYGSFVGFIIGWIVWIIGNVTSALLIVGAIQYLLPSKGTIISLLINVCQEIRAAPQ